MSDGGRCIILVGATNSGKSTLAREFAHRGHPVIHYDRLIREAHVQGVLIDRGVHGDGLEPHLVTGSNHT